MAFMIRFFGAGTPPAAATIANAAAALDPGFAFDRLDHPQIEAWRMVDNGSRRSLFGVLEVVSRGSEAFDTDVAEFAAGVVTAEGERETVRDMLERCDFIASVECIFVGRSIEENKAGLAPIWDWLTATYPGLIHVDDEGFYRDADLILALK